MSYIAISPEHYKGQVVGSGQCVDFVKKSAGTPPSSSWKKGIDVLGNNIPAGTAIATFDADGHYPSNKTGNHAAILVNQTSDSITVWDQWKGQSVHQRRIVNRHGNGSPSNDASLYSVIE